MLNYFPKYFTTRATLLYLIIWLALMLIFPSNILPLVWFLFGIISVLLFFQGSNVLTKRWKTIPTKVFLKKLFWLALVIRVLYVFFSYFFYWEMTGDYFDFEAADSVHYHQAGFVMSDALRNGHFIETWQFLYKYYGNTLSDIGYQTYLSIIYFISFDSILFARLLKAVMSAYVCILMYKLTKRNFGEGPARMTAIFCLLMPNFIYYCGVHLKEAEMLFLTVLFVERADFILREKNIPITQIIVVAIIGLGLFTFRTVLGAVAFLALFATMIFSSGKVISTGRKIALSFLFAVTVAVGLGNDITTEVERTWESREGSQENSMDYRSKRKGGNELAKYGASALFLPMIFTAPFPTMVHIENQQSIMLLNGGYFVKNITSFFTLFALLLLFIRKKWRQNLMPLFFLSGYLMVLALSSFAISERFHVIALPFNIMFAAYGIASIINKQKLWYNLWLGFILIVIIGWNWFKLAGRGIV